MADVVILRPAEPARGNGTLLLEVPNRGRKLALPLFNDAPGRQRPRQAGDAGSGFLYAPRLHHGLGRLAGRHPQPALASSASAARRRWRGVTGPVREEFRSSTTAQNPAGDAAALRPGRPAEPARLTVRQAWDDAAPDHRPTGLRASTTAGIEITRPAGFDAGAFYESPTRRKDPAVLASASPRCATSSPSCATRRGRANPLAGRPCTAPRLRRLAERPLPARLPLSGLQRGHRRAASCSTG